MLVKKRFSFFRRNALSVKKTCGKRVRTRKTTIRNASFLLRERLQYKVSNCACQCYHVENIPRFTLGHEKRASLAVDRVRESPVGTSRATECRDHLNAADVFHDGIHHMLARSGRAFPSLSSEK